MNESILQQFNCCVSCYFIAFFTVFLTLFMSSPSSHKKLESPLNLIHAKSNYGQEGGVAVYTNVRLRFAQMKSFLIHGSESIWLIVRHQESTKTLVIGTVCRHPKKNVNQFVEDFSEYLEKLTSVNSTFYILGDINININKSSLESSPAKKYTDAITSSGAVAYLLSLY